MISPNHTSPVLFFIDDLRNKWIDLNSDGIIQTEEDHGHAGLSAQSSFSFLKNRILVHNPNIRVTFFVPVSAVPPIITDSPIKSHSYPINHDERSIQFFRTIGKDPRYEFAYHGTTHGSPGKTTHEFVHEWLTYNNIDEANKRIAFGKKIFDEAFGFLPTGGKYCGYRSNDISDQSIDESGFVWWCRYDNRTAVKGHADPYYSGADDNPLTAYNLKFFGKKCVVDIPTTVYSNLLNPLFKTPPGIKGWIKRILRQFLIKRMLEREIGFLIKKKLIVSIQTHMSPSREDGKRQSLNIIDDAESLKAIFKYLKRRQVWYCTGRELAEWARSHRNAYPDH